MGRGGGSVFKWFLIGGILGFIAGLAIGGAGLSEVLGGNVDAIMTGISDAFST